MPESTPLGESDNPGGVPPAVTRNVTGEPELVAYRNTYGFPTIPDRGAPDVNLIEGACPYRVVNIPVDDLGASAAKKYDIEAWLPGQGRYRELTSCSNTTDYQSRRLGIRYRPVDGRPTHVHTLNGTAVTSSRTIIALLENGQREDGSVALPAVLQRHGAPEMLAPAH